MIDFEVNPAELDRLIRDVGAIQSDAEKALKSTLIKMARWLKTRSVKGLSVQLQMKQNIIRRRLRATRVRETASGAETKVWYGLNNVGVVWLNPKQNGRGVSASGGRQYDQAWIGKHQVFKRRGKSRLPIDPVKEPIKDKADNFLEHGIVSSIEFSDQFYKTFEHELSWRMQQRR